MNEDQMPGNTPVADDAGTNAPVQSRNCVACSQPLQPGQSHCPGCGAEQPVAAAPAQETPVESGTQTPPVESDSTPTEDSPNQGGGTSGGMGEPTV